MTISVFFRSFYITPSLSFSSLSFSNSVFHYNTSVQLGLPLKVKFISSVARVSVSGVMADILRSVWVLNLVWSCKIPEGHFPLSQFSFTVWLPIVLRCGVLCLSGIIIVFLSRWWTPLCVKRHPEKVIHLLGEHRQLFVWGQVVWGVNL